MKNLKLFYSFLILFSLSSFAKNIAVCDQFAIDIHQGYSIEDLLDSSGLSHLTIEPNWNYKNINSYVISGSAEVWDDFYLLLDQQGVVSGEVLCEAEVPKVNYRELEDREQGDNIECNPFMIFKEHCDPLWALKQTKIVQKDKIGEWNDSWIQRLITDKKIALNQKRLQLIAENKLDEAATIKRQMDEMKPFGEGVLIGFPDTGVTPNPELGDYESIFDGAIDFVDGVIGSALDPMPLLFSSHGTSIISSVVSPAGKQLDTVNPYFVRGAARHAKIRPYRVHSGWVIHLNFENVIKSVLDAISSHQSNDTTKKVRVINMSLGGPFPSRRLQGFLQAANHLGITTIAASGNYIPNWVLGKFVVWPAKYDETIAMAATTFYNNPWNFSSKGKQIDFAAPGHLVWASSTRKADDGGYIFLNRQARGTSLATSLTTSVVTLWNAFHGETKLSEYKENKVWLLRYLVQESVEKGHIKPLDCDRYQSSCEDIKNGLYGPGVINADSLLRQELPSFDQLMKWKTEKLEKREKNQLPELEALANFQGINQRTLRNHLSFLTDEQIQRYGKELWIHFYNDSELRESLKNSRSFEFIKRLQERASGPLSELMQGSLH